MTGDIRYKIVAYHMTPDGELAESLTFIIKVATIDPKEHTPLYADRHELDNAMRAQARARYAHIISGKTRRPFTGKVGLAESEVTRRFND